MLSVVIITIDVGAAPRILVCVKSVPNFRLFFALTLLAVKSVEILNLQLIKPLFFLDQLTLVNHLSSLHETLKTRYDLFTHVYFKLSCGWARHDQDFDFCRDLLPGDYNCLARAAYSTLDQFLIKHRRVFFQMRQINGLPFFQRLVGVKSDYVVRKGEVSLGKLF